jgi:Ca2+-binding RTX toxin-like protein
LTFAAPPDFEQPNDVGGAPGDNTYLVDVRVSDGLGGTGTQSIAVTVNGSHAVTANDDIVITNVIDDLFTIPASALLANDADSQGHPLHIETVTDATQNGSGDVNFVANSSSESFYYTASDGEVGSAPAHVTVTTQDGVVLGDEGTLLNEILIAGGDDDFLEGFGGADFLFGGVGADTMYADEGNDTLVGGAGDDYMVGGADADIFDYNAIADAGTAGDFIEDFSTLDVDQLDLHDLLATFSGYTPETAFSGGYLSVVDSPGGALVQVDSDGLGGGGAITLVTLNGITANTIDAGDFIL